MRLLSEGTLSVARFDDDGSVQWLPLVFGEGPLTPANGFASQADVLIDARLAADALKATRMDRPEDVQPAPGTGKVYVMLTNNERRRPEQVDKANPRPQNEFGHIIEMTAPDGDHAAATFKWDMLIKCGDPRVAEVGAMWNPATSADGWFASPDNCADRCHGPAVGCHRPGRGVGQKTGKADGLYAVWTEGADARAVQAVLPRARSERSCAARASRPTARRVFLAVQHPATDGVQELEAVRPRVDLRGPRHALAGLQAGHAAAPLRRRHPQEGRRQDRVGLNSADSVIPGLSPDPAIRALEQAADGSRRQAPG